MVGTSENLRDLGLLTNKSSQNKIRCKQSLLESSRKNSNSAAVSLILYLCINNVYLKRVYVHVITYCFLGFLYISVKESMVSIVM